MSEIAVIALITSVISIGIGIIGLKIQREHDILSVRPIASVGLQHGNIIDNDIVQNQGLNMIVPKYSATLGVGLSNCGCGPMIIKSIETVNKEGVKKSYPYEWIPIDYRQQFYRDLENTAIPPGVIINLITFNFPLSDLNELHKKEEIKSILNDLTIRIKYTDIYNLEQPDYVKSIKDFGENPSN